MQYVLRGIDWLNELSGRIFSWLVVVIMLITVYDVAMRNFAGQPTIWAFDVSNQLYAVHFLMLAGFGLLHNSHVSVDVLWARLRPRTQAIVDLISYLVFFLPFMLMLIWQSYLFAARSWASRETSWGVMAMPLYPLKTVMVIASVLLLLQGIAIIIRRIQTNVQGDRKSTRHNT